jgi:hypothetical protein
VLAAGEREHGFEVLDLLVAEGGEPAARTVPAEVGGVDGETAFRETSGQRHDLLVALRAGETVAEHDCDVGVDRAVTLHAECHAVRCGKRERFALPRDMSAAVGHAAVDAASRPRSGQRTFVAQPNFSKRKITRADESIWCGAAPWRAAHGCAWWKLCHDSPNDRIASGAKFVLWSFVVYGWRPNT